MQFSIYTQPYDPGVPPLEGDVDIYEQVYILVKDDLGNPIDGDNVIVYYKYLQGDDIGPIESVTIPGQSVLIYEGIVQHNGGPYKSYVLTGSSAPGLPSPPLIPDLAIQSIEIIKKANSAGANGIVKINATSSYGPLTYYIDDIEVNPLFSGISAGLHTAKVVDANLNEVEREFSVPQADSILLSDPSLTAAGKVSRWNAAFNPVVFRYQRKDFDVTGITQDETTLKPKIVIDTDLTGVVVGDFVYLDAGVTNGESTYKGAYKVLVIVSTNTVVIDTAYVAPDTIGGFANINALRPYYKVITRIKYVNPVTGLFETIDSTNRPGLDGITKANINNFLQSLLKLADISDYTQINYRDTGLGASYQISYAETWDGNTPEFSDISNPFYAVYAAKQLGEFGGGNLYKFVTQPGGTVLAKWLTDFIEPSYTTGYAFDLGFIYSEQIAGRQLYYKYQPLDINRQPVGGGAVTTFLLNEDASFILNQDGTKLVIARQTLVNTPIVEHVGVNRLLIDQDFGAIACYVSVQLFYDDDETPVPVTEELIVRIDRACAINPVYLRWIGLSGSWNYFRFNYNQTKTLDVQNAVIIKNFVNDWQNDEGIDEVVSKDASEKLQVFADALDKNDINGLQSIKYSPKVQILVNKNPVKWQTVVVNTSTFAEYDTQNGQSEFNLTFNMPSKNIQTQ